MKQSIERKLWSLFDYQKFENNRTLRNLIWQTDQRMYELQKETEMNNMVNDEALATVSGGAAKMRKIGVATVLTTNLNIRRRATTDSPCVGQTNAPAKYDVFEITQNEGYIWYRISDNMWIANDGTWVSFVAA